ncbi:MAG TPA: ABC transporter substrate-binding protein [Methylophilaceae bacterium]|jgi:NitT/TauT family transport system substrate-binding protein
MLSSKRVSNLKKLMVALSIPLAMAYGNVSQAAEPLKIAYSDWPGFVAWQVAIDKGWFKEAGIDVKFEWFDYGASMDAFTAGKVDAVFVTNGDALVVGSGGAKNTMILITDYSNGNDMIIGKPGVKSIKDLKGKKVGTEVGIVDHLLLLDALQKSGMKESDITIVNTKINDTPQALAAGDLAAIGVFEPSASQALKLVAGSKPIYTSAQSPGLIYDVLTVNPASLSNHKAEWSKLTPIWAKVVAYINDPKTQPDALKIMSARDGLTPQEYVKFLKGTRLLNVAEGKAALVKADGLKSLYGSTVNADAFNVKNAIYKAPQDINKYIDPVLYK